MKIQFSLEDLNQAAKRTLREEIGDLYHNQINELVQDYKITTDEAAEMVIDQHLNLHNIHLIAEI